MKIQLIYGAVAISLMTSCKKDDEKVTDDHYHQTELITTLTLSFNHSATVPYMDFTFRDADGPGGAVPDIFDTIVLADSSRYLVNILLLDESKSPADTVSNEVLGEAEDHLFCFEPDDASLGVKRMDSDSNGLGIGLRSLWVTSSGAQGSVRVILKHQEDIKDGSCDRGETDVEVNFPLIIK